MKFLKQTAASAILVTSLTMQYAVAVHPVDAVITSGETVVGTGLTKLDEILLMTPLWRDMNFRFTVEVHPQEVRAGR